MALSDLHRCSAKDGGGAEIVLGRLADDLRHLRDEHDLRPDLVFMTGDLAFGQAPGLPLEDQLLEGWEWLTKVRQLYDPQVGIAGFNSAWSCGGDGEKGKLWLAGDWQLEQMVPKLKDADVRIALVHHPFNWFVESEDSVLTPRFQSEIHILLHGHEHQLWVQTPHKDHLHIAAGAVVDRPDATLGYNLVQFDLEAKSGEVWLRTFDHRAGQWKGDEIPGRTDDNGVWTIGLPWDPSASQPDPEPSPPEPELDLTDPEKRGVFGRQSDIDKLRRLLDEKRIVAVYGLSGIGKTRLIEEVARATDREYRIVRVMPGTGFVELYGRLVLELGCREPDPRPLGVAGSFNFSEIGKWANALPGPRVVHVEGGHHLFDRTKALEPNVVAFFKEIARGAAKVRLLVESQVTPPAVLLPDDVYGRQKVKGIRAKHLNAYFRRPLPDRPEVGWRLGKAEIEELAAHLSISKKMPDDVHPLALFLLVAVASDLGVEPLDAFQQYGTRIHKELREGLFDILYDKVLSPAEQRMLRLCASELRRRRIADDTRHIALFHDEAKYLRSRGQLQDALGLLEQAEQMGIADDYTLNLRASILSDLRRGTEASELRRRSITKGSRQLAFYHAEAEYWRSLGEPREAIAILNQAVEKGISDGSTLNLLGELLGKLGRDDEPPDHLHELLARSLEHAARQRLFLETSEFNLPYLSKDIERSIDHLQPFRSAAEDLLAAERSHNYYHQRTALDRAVTTLSGAQFAISGQREARQRATPFLNALQVWLEVVANEQTKLARRRSEHPQVPVPFVVGSALGP